MRNSRFAICGAMVSMLAITGGPVTGNAAAAEAYDFNALAKLSSDVAYDNFVRDLWPDAKKAGISRSIFDQAMAGFTPDAEILRLMSRQPEFSTAIWDYVEKRVSAARIQAGREKRALYNAKLAKIEKRYGVDRHIILAIWGMETNYGGYTGKKSVVRSLATIAHSGRRTKFGRQQLIAALQILQNGDISLAQFQGSWAGAMGHTQFIPTTYNHYAVDWTGDGKRDIWNSVSDALASTGNYLAKRGWKPGYPWGWEVKLPRDFDYRAVGAKGERTMAGWAHLKVAPAEGGSFGVPAVKAKLVLPAGLNGPAFLVTSNFKAILAYNNSTAYALAVGHLADRIRGQGPFVAQWPRAQKVLSLAERQELQSRLNHKGYHTGGNNGRIGKMTFSAIQSYQTASGLPADGYASATLLERLRKDR